MPLSPPVFRRALQHTRVMDTQAFARDDGLWDIDARSTDVTTRDARPARGPRPVDLPYPGHCDTIGPAHRALVGLNLMNNFRRERLRPGLRACAVRPARDGAGVPHEKPFQLDTCHALQSDGAAVAQYYPRWFVPTAPG